MRQMLIYILELSGVEISVLRNGFTLNPVRTGR